MVGSAVYSLNRNRSVNSFDYAIISFLNRFAQRSWTFDSSVVLLSDTSLLKGAIIVACLWYAWFRPGEQTKRNRELILCGLIWSVPALAIVRFLAWILPFRHRPFHNPVLHFTAPYSLDPRLLLPWNSFPSDHAVLFTLLSTIVLLASRPLGVFACGYTLVFILFPRVYLGFHYPTDILAGALAGSGFALLALSPSIRSFTTRRPLRLMETHVGLFYAALFAISFEVGEGFRSSVDAARYFLTTVRAIALRFLN